MITRTLNYICVLIFVLIFSSGFSTHAQNIVQPERKIISSISSKKFTEFAPTISADGRIMIFESNRDKSWKLYESHLESKGDWSNPYPLTAINEKLNFLAGPNLSHDGNTLWFTGFIEAESVSEDIYYAIRLDDKSWSEPKNIGAPINTDAYEGFPSISADGNSLYFIRVNDENPTDRKTKESCFNIFVSNKKNDGTWAVPTLLPPTINSGCVRDPKIMSDNHTLIFSSIAANGKGKYDLYQSRKSGDSTWEDSVPLDFVNSAENDQSPCISAAGEVMFFYSNDDIYSIAIPPDYRQMVNITLEGYAMDEKTNSPIKTNLVVANINTGKSFTTQTSSDGKYSIVLNAGNQYKIEFINDTYVPGHIAIDLRDQDKYTEMKKNIYIMKEYKVGLTVQDKDLNKNMSAWLNVVDRNGQTLFKDSLEKDHYPYNIKLEAAKNYTISLEAEGYTTLVSEWTFDQAKIKPEMTQVLQMEHTKVSIATDVVDIVTNQKVKSKIYFNNENIDEVIVVEAGEPVFLRKGDRYQVVSSSDKGYLFSTTTIIAGENNKQQDDQSKLILKSIAIVTGAQLTLDHISFAVNSAELNTTSYLALDRVIELLQKNSTISIQISAHTDDVGDDTYNQRLSERRALCIVRYLTKKGVEIQRMRPTGHGKTKPLVPNDSDENRARNRRVELQVLRVD